MEKGKQVWFDRNIEEREVEEEEARFGSDVVHGDSSCSTRILRNVQELFAKCNPLGLTLTKTQSLVNFFEIQLHPPQEAILSTQVESQRNSRARTSRDNLVTQPSAEKLKATNFPVTSIRIGAWQRNSQNEGDLIAKLYYAKRKIVWEVLDEKVLEGNDVKMKSKIEILWSNITAIQAIFRDDQPGILKIELDKPPVFFRETKPEPKKHTNWESNDHFDFTGGQARISRIHCVSFPPKVLDKHYENLLQSDQQLFNLSQAPFPSQRYPYFQSPVIMTNFNVSGSPIIQQYRYPTNHPTVARGLSFRQPPNPVMGFPRNYQLMSHRQPRPVWENQRMNYPMSTSSSSSMFASQTPANEIIFTGHPNDHAQMQAMDLVLDTNNINPNDQVMPNPTDNNGTGHCDVYAQPNNIMETDVDYSVLPFVSLDDDDDDHDLILDRYPNQHV